MSTQSLGGTLVSTPWSNIAIRVRARLLLIQYWILLLFGLGWCKLSIIFMIYGLIIRNLDIVP